MVIIYCTLTNWEKGKERGESWRRAKNRYELTARIKLYCEELQTYLYYVILGAQFVLDCGQVTVIKDSFPPQAHQKLPILFIPRISVSDPHSFNPDPDPDPDPA